MKNILSTEEIEKYSDITDFVITYTRENIAYAKFFIKEPFYTKSLRDVPITVMAFIGNTGGLVSLCLGYFATPYLYNNTYRKESAMQFYIFKF